MTWETILNVLLILFYRQGYWKKNLYKCKLNLFIPTSQFQQFF